MARLYNLDPTMSAQDLIPPLDQLSLTMDQDNPVLEPQMMFPVVPLTLPPMLSNMGQIPDPSWLAADPAQHYWHQRNAFDIARCQLLLNICESDFVPLMFEICNKFRTCTDGGVACTACVTFITMHFHRKEPMPAPPVAVPTAPPVAQVAPAIPSDNQYGYRALGITYEPPRDEFPPLATYANAAKRPCSPSDSDNEPNMIATAKHCKTGKLPLPALERSIAAHEKRRRKQVITGQAPGKITAKSVEEFKTIPFLKQEVHHDPTFSAYFKFGTWYTAWATTPGELVDARIMAIYTKFVLKKDRAAICAELAALTAMGHPQSRAAHLYWAASKAKPSAEVAARQDPASASKGIRFDKSDPPNPSSPDLQLWQWEKQVVKLWKEQKTSIPMPSRNGKTYFLTERGIRKNLESIFVNQYVCSVFPVQNTGLETTPPLPVDAKYVDKAVLLDWLKAGKSGIDSLSVIALHNFYT